MCVCVAKTASYPTSSFAGIVLVRCLSSAWPVPKALILQTMDIRVYRTTRNNNQGQIIQTMDIRVYRTTRNNNQGQIVQTMDIHVYRTTKWVCPWSNSRAQILHMRWCSRWKSCQVMWTSGEMRRHSHHSSLSSFVSHSVSLVFASCQLLPAVGVLNVTTDRHYAACT